MRQRWISPGFFLASFMILGSICPAEAQNPAPASDSPKVIDKVEFNDMSIEDAVAYLRAQDPNFKAIVARDSDAPSDYPKLSFLLNNVTAGEILTAIAQAYPAVELRVTGSSTAGMIIGAGGILTAPDSYKVIYVVAIHAPPASAKPPELVKVYNLEPLLGNTALSAANSVQIKGHTLKEILSLIQAVCDESNARPSLHVHEATNTLIVKGTREQQDAVAQAIQALMPVSSSSDVAQANAMATRDRLEATKMVEEAVLDLLRNLKAQRESASTQPANN